jgi:hypothetical protein
MALKVEMSTSKILDNDYYNQITQQQKGLNVKDTNFSK